MRGRGVCLFALLAVALAPLIVALPVLWWKLVTLLYKCVAVSCS